jgi:Protein of unknown function (DUF4031)
MRARNMTVYVDDMYRLPMGQFRRMKMSHMIADTEEELLAFADRLGLKREWYQGNHFDVSMSVRTKAISLGAKEIPLRELAAMVRKRRRKEAVNASGAVHS